MVLVEEIPTETANNSSGSSGSNDATSSSTSSSNRAGTSAGTSSTNGTNGSSPISFLLNDKISAALFLTRCFTIVTTFCFILPIFGYDPNTLYQKALMSSAATSALKLHQRMSATSFQFNRMFFANLFIEDSFHYLFYSIIFLNTYPITIVLMPIAAFALLHVSSYTKSLLDATGRPDSFGFIRKAINVVLTKDKDIMRFVAVNEIILFPTIIVMVFGAKCGIFVPFIYYRFVCMRYQSRRNPYNRVMFYELRVAIEQFSSLPSCPQIFRNLSQKLIGFISRLAPAQAA